MIVFERGVCDWLTLTLDTGLNGYFDWEKTGSGGSIVGRLFAKDIIVAFTGLTDWTISTVGIWLAGLSLKDTREADYTSSWNFTLRLAAIPELGFAITTLLVFIGTARNCGDFDKGGWTAILVALTLGLGDVPTADKRGLRMDVPGDLLRFWVPLIPTTFALPLLCVTGAQPINKIQTTKRKKDSITNKRIRQIFVSHWWWWTAGCWSSDDWLWVYSTGRGIV